MKTLLTVCAALLCLSTVSCKKETQSKNSLKNISYVFSPDGYSSSIKITKKTGVVINLSDKKEIVTVADTVSLGDRISIEMHGNAQGLNPNYFISINFNGHAIGKTGAHGAPGLHDFDLLIDHTFIPSDFN